MTAIITKQNVKDGAFTGGNNSPTANGEFETLHVKGDTIIDGNITSPELAVVGEAIIDFESRIKTLEENPAENLHFEDGLNNFIISADTLKTFENDDYNILEIEIDNSPNDSPTNVALRDITEFSGDLFEIIFPSYMNLSTGIISTSNNKFKNPCISYDLQRKTLSLESDAEKYTLNYINEDDKPRLYIHKTIINKPMDLFTSGFMRINYIAKIKQTINSKDNQLINFKCNTIDADNCFKLYRSPLPDFYEMKSYGITNDNEYYYADYGYIPGTPEFEALIDGQVFEFHDEAFGTDYKMTKKGNEWVGNNVSFHIPISASIKGETKFFKHQTQPLLIKQNETNKAILRAWISYYSNENPFKFINEKGLLKFVDCEIDKYVDNVNGYWAVYLKCTQKKSCNFTCSLMINGIEYQTEFGFEYASYEAESCYKVNTNNCYEYLPYHYNGKLEVGNPPYGLKLYMRTDKELIFKIADTKYEEGTNTFEFLASTGFYTVSPRPEACTTLFTNYNIQTSGVVIGENIESHVFVLNSLGNTVDIAVNQISQLQNYYVQLQQQLEEVKNKQNWFDIVKNVICIGGSVINFMGGPTKLLSIAKNGISSLIGMSFAADEELIEDAVIVACDRASTVLAEVKVEELDFVNEEPLLTENLNRYKYLCTSLKYDYHIEVSFEIDNEGEVIKTNTYTVNEDLTITNISADQSTIDCLIIYNSPYLIIDSNYKPIKVEVKRIPKRTNTELGLGAELRDDHILSSAATVKLIENHKVHLNESLTNKLSETLNNYASVQYVQDNYPSYTYLNANFKNNNQLTNILDAYALKTELPNIPDDLVNNETLTTTLSEYYTIGQVEEKFVDEDELAYELNNFALKTDIKELPTDLINETTLTTALSEYRTKDDLRYRNNDIILTKNNDILNYEFVDVSYTFTKYSTKILCVNEYYKIWDRNEFYIDATLTKNSNVITGTYKYELTHSNGVKKKYTCYEINYSLYLTTSGTISNINDTYIYDDDIVINKLGYNSKPAEFPDNKLLSAEYVNNEFNNFVNNEKLITTLNECDDKYVAKNGDATINGNLIVSGTITSSQSNTTITHYCPIELSLNKIEDFIIGAPVYLTGKVYKYDASNKFVHSTIEDTTDCISSVKTTGKWNEYIGICVKIDSKNNCITFASGGDYMVRVDDTTGYNIGDEVFIDNEDNKLKILSGQTAITSKIRRMTVGIITAKINDTMLAVFKS